MTTAEVRKCKTIVDIDYELKITQKSNFLHEDVVDYYARAEEKTRTIMTPEYRKRVFETH